MQWMDSPSSLVLSKSLDGLWQRQRAISENIANQSTPGYKRKVVAFEDMLSKEMLQNRSSRGELLDDLHQVRPRSFRDEATAINVDGNNVDADREFLQLTDTVMQYQFAQRLLNDNLSRLRYAITEGRG